jgi:hypothetical protein
MDFKDDGPLAQAGAGATEPSRITTTEPIKDDHKPLLPSGGRRIPDLHS